MGIPTFYRWLSSRFGDITQPLNEKVKVDNLYIDLNGVIHPCCHPEDDAAIPETEDEAFEFIGRYIKRLVEAIKPSQVLYLSIDGVAPRAKMNQQRMRRFKATAAAPTGSDDEDVDVDSGIPLDGVQGDRLVGVGWDSNVITPGTDFMHRLSLFLKDFVLKQLFDSEIWRELKIIISDASEPGEGEHKIVDFIRQMRHSKDYRNDITHCIHGMDADLIMLALATHEPHFYILRESIEVGARIDVAGDADAFERSWKPLTMIDINAVREYVDVAMGGEVYADTSMIVQEDCDDMEGRIDDFILLCFLVGNDFLPHLASLGIGKGSIDLLMALYRSARPHMDENLSSCGELSQESLQKYLEYVAKAEPAVLENEARRKAWMDKRDTERAAATLAEETRVQAQQPLCEINDDNNTLGDTPGGQSNGTVKAFTRFPTKEISDDPDVIREDLQLGVGDPAEYRTKFYTTMFKIGPDECLETFIARCAACFVDGMRWVLWYYYRGAPSWNWYYPFAFPPLAADLARYGVKSSFERDPIDPFIAATKHLKPSSNRCRLFVPWRHPQSVAVDPLVQLLSVLPLSSLQKAVRSDIADYLCKELKESITDLYPSSFSQDGTGKHAPWLYTPLLPLGDPVRLRERLEALPGDCSSVGTQKSRPIVISYRKKSVTPPSQSQLISFLPYNIAVECETDSTLVQRLVNTKAEYAAVEHSNKISMDFYTTRRNEDVLKKQSFKNMLDMLASNDYYPGTFSDNNQLEFTAINFKSHGGDAALRTAREVTSAIERGETYESHPHRQQQRRGHQGRGGLYRPRPYDGHGQGYRPPQYTGERISLGSPNTQRGLPASPPNRPIIGEGSGFNTFRSRGGGLRRFNPRQGPFSRPHS